MRTTPLVTAYRRQYPDCYITWVVDGAFKGVLEGIEEINELLTYSEGTLKTISENSYDLAINLDKEKEALDSIQAANARIKQGFGWNDEDSGVAALNEASEYAVLLGIDDDLKFRQNDKTYQQISYAQAEIDYSKDDYLFKLSSHELTASLSHLKSLGVDPTSKLVGVNTGSGEKFAGKRLPTPLLVDLTKRIQQEWGAPALLLGGPEEVERNKELEKLAQGSAINAGTHHTIQEFAGLVSQLSLVITGDTIAMHIAIAVKTPVLVYFGSTCAQEIELYGRGRKIVSKIDCAPCYKKDCPIDEKCMSDMNLDEVMRESKVLLR